MGGDGMNWANAVVKEVPLFPSCTSPRENHSPPLPNQSSGLSACWTSASEFHLQGKSQEKVGKSSSHFLVCPRRQTSSVQLRLMIHGCESPTAITKHRPLHPAGGW